MCHVIRHVSPAAIGISLALGRRHLGRPSIPTPQRLGYAPPEPFPLSSVCRTGREDRLSSNTTSRFALQHRIYHHSAPAPIIRPDRPLVSHVGRPTLQVPTPGMDAQRVRAQRRRLHGRCPGMFISPSPLPSPTQALPKTETQIPRTPRTQESKGKRN